MAVVPIRSGFLRNLRQTESRIQDSALRTVLGLQKPTSGISPTLSGTVGEFFQTKVTPPLQFLREPAQQVTEAIGGITRPSTFLGSFAVGGVFQFPIRAAGRARGFPRSEVVNIADELGISFKKSASKGDIRIIIENRMREIVPKWEEIRKTLSMPEAINLALRQGVINIVE